MIDLLLLVFSVAVALWGAMLLVSPSAAGSALSLPAARQSSGRCSAGAHGTGARARLRGKLDQRHGVRVRADPPRWDPTAPVWTEEDLEDIEVLPQADHTHTLIYLHAFGRCGKEYVPPLLDKLSPGFPCPWVVGEGHAPGLRVVLPTARKLAQPWGPVETSWHEYVEASSNDVGDLGALTETRERLGRILRSEIDRLKGKASNVFLGGLSQGCTAALDVYLQEASALGLGGFAGSVGFLPSDAQGFAGASAALEELVVDAVQGARPMWLQCALDDQWVPWSGLTEPSFRAVEGRMPGFQMRTVSGRGHVIDDWEGHLLIEFMRKHAAEACG